MPSLVTQLGGDDSASWMSCDTWLYEDGAGGLDAPQFVLSIDDGDDSSSRAHATAPPPVEATNAPAEGAFAFRQTAKARKMEERWMGRRRTEHDESLIWEVDWDSWGGVDGRIGNVFSGGGGGGGGGGWVCPECQSIVVTMDRGVVKCAVVGCQGVKPGSGAQSPARVPEDQGKDTSSVESALRAKTKRSFVESRGSAGARGRRRFCGVGRVLPFLACGVMFIMQSIVWSSTTSRTSCLAPLVELDSRAMGVDVVRVPPSFPTDPLDESSEGAGEDDTSVAPEVAPGDKGINSNVASDGVGVLDAVETPAMGEEPEIDTDADDTCVAPEVAPGDKGVNSNVASDGVGVLDAVETPAMGEEPEIDTDADDTCVAPEVAPWDVGVTSDVASDGVGVLDAVATPAMGEEPEIDTDDGDDMTAGPAPRGGGFWRGGLRLLADWRSKNSGLGEDLMFGPWI